MNMTRNFTRILAGIIATVLMNGALAQPQLSLITDHSGASEACGPVAIRWGFMCPIIARHGEHIYALNFTRTPDVKWDARQPIEAPIAFWSRSADGKWNSVLLDGPDRTYQTPTLLLSPDGTANVFALHPASHILQWFRGTDPTNSSFTRREIEMGWGSYLSGAIDSHGRVALFYWGNGGSDPSSYPHSSLSCTLVDTLSGKTKNLIVDWPGAPYCYNQVFFDDTGIHVLGIRSEVVPGVLICGTRNHYTDLRYYHCADPDHPKWEHQVIMHNEKACIQPLGNLVDSRGAVHLLYNYDIDDGHGKPTGHHLVYASSHGGTFVQHEIPQFGDGRLFITADDQVHLLAYSTENDLHHIRISSLLEDKNSAWQTIHLPFTFNRIFPIDPRSGSSPSDRLECAVIPALKIPQENSMFFLSTNP